MSNLTTLVQEFVNLDLEKQRLVAEAKKFFVNKDYSLDERWKLFELVEEYLPNDSFGDGLLDFASNKELSPYDDFYIERHQTSSYSDLLGYMIPDAFNTEEDLAQKGITTETIVRWKEAVLKAGDGSFTFDW